MKRTIIFIFLLLSIFSESKSQKLYFENYTVNDNIPSSQINVIYQDTYGFIWVGTEEGLRKFDGISFKELLTNDNREILGSINSITETKQHIYITSKRSIYKSVGSEFSEQIFYTKTRPHEINKSIATDTTLVMLTTKGLWMNGIEKVVKLKTNTFLDNANITSGCYVASKQLLWLNCNNRGLVIYDLKNNKIITSNIIGLNNPIYNEITELYAAKNGDVYIAEKGNGLFRYTQKIEQIKLPTDFNVTSIKKIDVDKLNNIWLATLNDGLVKISENGFKKYGKNEGIDYSECLSVINDKEGNTWLGTLRGGLFLIKKSKFSIFNSLHNLPSDNVKAIKVSNLGTTYVITDNGFALFDGLTFKNLTPYLENNIPTSLAVSDNDVAAVGCLNGTIYFVKNNLFISKLKISANDVTALHFLNQSNLIATTENGEIFSITMEDFSIKKITNQFLNNSIYAITSDGEKQIWVSTSRGVYKIDNQTTISKQFETFNELSNNESFDIIFKNNKLYLTTSCCGVIVYNLKTKTYQVLNKRKGLSSNIIKAIFIEDDNEAFITTNNMLNHVVFNDSVKEIKQYKSNSNNESIEFTIGCLNKDYFGNILAGTNKGLLVFNPIEDSASRVQPKIVIESIMLGNKITDWNDFFKTNQKTGLPYQLNLKHNQNDIAFEFIGLKFSTNEKFYYSYKLVGLEDDYVNCNQQNKALYSNLPNGDYEFLARVSTNNKTWSNPISYKFTIEKPFWKTPLFLFLIFVAICVIVFLIFKNQLSFNNSLVTKSNSVDVTLNSGRMILFFASIIIPIGGIVYHFIYENKDTITIIHLILGMLILAFAASTYVSSYAKQNIQNMLIICFVLILIGYQFIIYFSNVEPYFIISLILAITTVSAILNSLKTYCMMAILIFSISVLMSFLVAKPNYSQGLYLFAILAAFSIGVLILLVKLNLSDKLIFADTVINKGSSLIIASNKNGEIIYINKAFETILGYNESEVLGNKYWELNNENNKAANVKEKIINKTISKTNIVEVKTKNKGKKWIHWENNYLDGDILVGIGNDISTQKEYQERFEYIVKNAKDIIYTTDAEGIINFVNDTTVQITEFESEEILGQHFLNMVKPSFKKEISIFYTRQSVDKITQTYKELPILTKSGNTIWLGQSVIFKFDAVSGNLLGSETICRDITDRIYAQNKLDENSKRLELLNEVKEKILSSTTIDEVCVFVLEALAKSKNVSSFISIHVNDDRHKLTFIYNHNDKEIIKQKTNYENYSTISNHFPELISSKQKILNAFDLDSWKPLFFYLDDKYQSAMMVPINLSNTIIGFINFFAPIENVYNAEDSWVLNNIAESISSFVNAYNQKQIVEEKNTEINLFNKRLQILNEAKHQIVTAINFEELGLNLNSTLFNSFENMERASITKFDLINYKCQVCYLNNSITNTSGISYGILTSDENAIENLQKEIPHVYFNYDEHILLPPDDEERKIKGIKSVILFPITLNNKLYGVINVMSKTAHNFNQDTISILKEIADDAALVIQQFDDKKEIEEKNELIQKSNFRLEILNKSKQRLINKNELSDLFIELILILKQNLFNISRISVCQFNFNTKVGTLFYLNTEANTDKVDTKFINTNSISRIESLIQNKTYYNPNFENETNLNDDDNHWLSVGIKSVLSVPIFINNELYGSIYLLSNIPNNFDDNHIILIEEIVETLASIIVQINYKNIIAEKNKDTTDNITYAKRIQDALMPQEQTLKQYLPESFLFFSQKDILGGDFYWFDKIGARTYIVVGDCTGHGVSGALLSILASDIIKQAVLELHLTDPGAILENLNWKIQNTLNQYNSGNEIIDGLDISLAIIDHRLNVMMFSSAMHTAFLVRFNELIEIKGSRKPIGAGYQMKNSFFSTNIVTIYENDTLYFLTDGYCDQFNPLTNKKFGKIRFKQMLLTINDKPIEEQKQIIVDTYFDWKGSALQTDDVCMIGIKL